MKTPTDWDEPLDTKGLAAALKRSRSYVQDMKACGFPMIAGRATLRMALDWLARNPECGRARAAAFRFVRRNNVRQRATPAA